jgi:hypothetical protein
MSWLYIDGKPMPSGHPKTMSFLTQAMFIKMNLKPDSVISWMNCESTDFEPSYESLMAFADYVLPKNMVNLESPELMREWPRSLFGFSSVETGRTSSKDLNIHGTVTGRVSGFNSNIEERDRPLSRIFNLRNYTLSIRKACAQFCGKTLKALPAEWYKANTWSSAFDMIRAGEAPISSGGRMTGLSTLHSLAYGGTRRSAQMPHDWYQRYKLSYLSDEMMEAVSGKPRPSASIPTDLVEEVKYGDQALASCVKIIIDSFPIEEKVYEGHALQLEPYRLKSINPKWLVAAERGVATYMKAKWGRK